MIGVMSYGLDRLAVKVALSLFWGGVLIFALFGLGKYSGSAYVFVLFTVVSNLLLYAGFRKNAIFFDTFIGIFTWLGFWLKFTIRIVLSGGVFHEPVGNFDATADAFDLALLVATCGLGGFLLASYVREKFYQNQEMGVAARRLEGLFEFYKHNRSNVLIGFFLLFVIVAITNAYLGIYQRGMITQTNLPWGLNGIYKWLLLFGLSSVSALILAYELQLYKKITYRVVMLSFLESFASNVSLLSRGMILNTSALLYGLSRSMAGYEIKPKMRLILISMLTFVLLFVSSVYLVNYLRSSAFSGEGASFQGAHSMTTPLIIDRWVGMEGVMAVSSYPHLGWALWGKAWKERYNENDTSYYDNNIISSPYANADKSAHHFISLPGIIAFFFYPGSFIFLFLSMLVLGLLGAAIEIFVSKLGGNNIILCALIAQVVAFRYMSFGYVPGQSYLLFGSIFLNVMIIYFLNMALVFKYAKSSIFRKK